MSIKQKSIKILWSASAGYCSFPDCNERLCLPEASDVAPYTLGEMAHIKGDKLGSNRHDESMNQEERDDYSNLILLCPTHHRLIDKKENEDQYSPERLQKMKGDHEQRVVNAIEKNAFSDIEAAKAKISALLSKNYLVWKKYGPLSDLARQNPNSERVYAVWLNERLSVIVPNNRKILLLLDGYESLFNVDEHELIEEFKMHAISYEKWVEDEIEYDLVTRFPSAFSYMIKGDINAASQ